MKRSGLALSMLVAFVFLLAYGFGKPAILQTPLLGSTAPSFALRSTSGQVVRLSNLHGHPVVVNFFASWCVSCRADESNLVRVSRRFGSRVRFVGIIFEDSGRAAADFTRQRGGAWPDLVDPGGRTAVAYGVTGIPETFFINSRGVVKAHSVSLSSSALRNGIATILRSS